jgi:SAM-dependent methyltransferase
MSAKLLLSRLPARYAFWQSLGLFKHGPMEDPDYAYRVFRKHFDRASFPRKSGGYVVAELGPGDTLGTALVAASLGASRCILVDVGNFARSDLEPYLVLHEFLLRSGLTPPDISGARSIQDVLARCNATYLTRGLASLRELPPRSVDFVFSNAVYEHIRRAEVTPMTREIARILTPGGVTSHSIDMKDHLGGGLANLRFSDRLWESSWMASSGFYTNRLRSSDFESTFTDAGLEVDVLRRTRWQHAPLKRSRLAPMFRHYSDDELAISDMDLVATQRP